MAKIVRGDFGWDYPPGVTGNEPQITGEDERMLNTTHIFNKAVLAARSRQDIESIHGLDVDELIAALHKEMGHSETSPLGKQSWAMVVGVEIGRLLCDPATHLGHD